MGNIAIYYECGLLQENGQCTPGADYVEILYREKHAPGYLTHVYGRMIENFCVDPTKLETVEHNGD